MDFTLWKVRRHPGYPVDDIVLYDSAKKKYSTVFVLIINIEISNWGIYFLAINF